MMNLTEVLKKETTFNPLSLRINFSWMFIGNAFYSLCQWGIIAYQF